MELFADLKSFGDAGLIALRIAVGAIFLLHGTQKLGMWKAKPSEQMSVGMLSVMKILSVAEPLGAIAIIAGFLTPFAAIGLGIIMIGAIVLKIKVMKVPFVAYDKIGWELDLLILAACIALLVFGGGAVSFDRFIFGV